MSVVMPDLNPHQTDGTDPDGSGPACASGREKNLKCTILVLIVRSFDGDMTAGLGMSQSSLPDIPEPGPLSLRKCLRKSVWNLRRRE
ncbi:hypothetical protein RRG08_010366 [Elysia crispata]|uniref:Uncharacterized protein n=1 Tax=Elysia crispata TaxID=231223 RepID=A0AAE0Z3S8_9GAST|nr:hypothetical protein RRG08_010366 [Elysia crispata]